MIYLPYTLTLRSNLILTGETGDPNSAATLHYIPGSSMRGVLAARLHSDPPSPQFKELILDGGISFLHAYPAADSQRSMPAPLSWRKEKYAGAVHDLAAYAGTEDWPGTQLEGAVDDPVIAGGEILQPVPIRTSSRLHNQRDRDRGHAWKRETASGEEGEGTIFFYESIESGQQFAGLLALRDRATAATVKTLLPDQSIVLLGRSRRAGYGGEAALHWQELRETEWRARPATATGKSLRIVFTSPYIGRNGITGQLDPSWACQEIARALGPSRIEAIDPIWGFTVVRGYNRRWRLRVTEAPALRAGSVLVIRLKDTVPQEVLSQLEDQGLGERRIEGYGRLLVLGPAGRSVTLSQGWQPAPATEPASPSPLLDQIEERLLLARLDREIEVIAAEIAKNAQKPLPRASLLGRLLVPFRAGEIQGVQTLRSWLAAGGSTTLRRPARDQLHRCKIRVEGKSRTLEELLAGILGENQQAAVSGTGLVDMQKLCADVARNAHLRGEQKALDCLNQRMELARGRLIVAILSRLAKRAAADDATEERGGQRATANPR